MSRSTIQCDAGWLLFDAPMPESPISQRDSHCRISDVAARLLGLSSSLPPSWKLALVGESDLRVRAEQAAPIEPDATEARSDQLQSTYVFVAASLMGASKAGSSRLPMPQAMTPLHRSSENAEVDVASLCREAGWLFDERDDGSLVVDLGVPGAYVPAVVEVRGSKIMVEAIIATESSDTQSDLSRVALATMLLRTNGAFRMIRGVLQEVEHVDEGAIDGRYRALIEAPLSLEASALEVGRAIGAVAVSVQHCATEAQALMDNDRIAQAYLSHGSFEDPVTPMPEIDTSNLAWA